MSWSFRLHAGRQEDSLRHRHQRLLPEKYSELGSANRKFDLAFVNYYMAINAAKGEKPASLDADGVAKIKELIAAKNTVLMHIQPSAASSVAAMMPELEKQLPGVLKSEMDSRVF